MDLRAIGIAASLGSAASWAIGAILFQRLGEQIPPLALTLLKGALSVVLLALALLLTGYGAIDGRSLLLLVFSGILGISVGDTFFFAALNDLGAHALVVLSTLGEVLTIALAVLFLGERHNVSAWLGIACVVAGITIVLGSKLRGEKSASGWRGIAFGLMAVLCMSVSTVIAKEGLEGVSALQATFIRMVSGTLGMFVFGTATGQVGKWISPLRDIHLVSRLFLSVGFITFGGFWLSLVSIQYIDVSIANSLNTTDPIFVLLLAAIFFKEKITRPAAIGTAMTVAGIVALWHE